MQVGTGHDNHHVTVFLCLADCFRMAGHVKGMLNPPGIGIKIFPHGNGDTVFEQIALPGDQLRRHGAKALFSMRTVGGAAKIHFRIEHSMTAFSAFPLAVVLEKFDTVAAVRALGLKNILSAPVAAVLSRAFHDSPR